jgi:nucleoside-specific outer membrane channel protein Tsx
MATDSFKAVFLRLDTPEKEITQYNAYPIKQKDTPLELENGQQIFIHRDVVDQINFKGNKHAKVLDNLALLLT